MNQILTAMHVTNERRGRFTVEEFTIEIVEPDESEPQVPDAVNVPVCTQKTDSDSSDGVAVLLPSKIDKNSTTASKHLGGKADLLVKAKNSKVTTVKSAAPAKPSADKCADDSPEDETDTTLTYKRRAKYS